jgi:Xaa-Pro aminopeptidase
MTITAPGSTRAASLGSLKLAQAQSLLREHDLDVWLTVVRESADRPDPNLRFFTDLDFTWSTFFLVAPGWSAALVATFDAPDLEALGLFDEVATYKEGPRAALLSLLDRARPTRIGINVSEDDALADGITAGLRSRLEGMLAETAYATRLTSAAPFLTELRSVKLPEERARIERAVDETEAMFDRVRDEVRVGMTARDIASRFQAQADAARVRTAWPRHHCPTVTVGARAPVGHVGPGEEPVVPGSVVHVDFGIVRDGYCSDLQRLWYVPAKGSSEAPEPVRRAYATIVETIERAARDLTPGTPGWEIDRNARDLIVKRGYPEYAHALGHHLGRAVHDGGGVLGPKWERYGREPYEPVREGSVFTLEPSIYVPDHGMVALEEDVVVTETGGVFLSRFPREIPILRTA